MRNVYLLVLAPLIVLGFVGAIHWVVLGLRDGIVRQSVSTTVLQESPGRVIVGWKAVLIGLGMMFSGVVALVGLMFAASSLVRFAIQT